jgi:hypothetical protein
LEPFSKTIADTLYKICSGSGSKRTDDDDNNNSGDSPDRQRAINIFTDFLACKPVLQDIIDSVDEKIKEYLKPEREKNCVAATKL